MPPAKKPPAGVGLLDFFGDRDDPTPLDEVYQRDPLLAKSEAPAELRELRSQRSIYLPAPKSSKSRVPPLRQTRVAGRDDFVRVDVPTLPDWPMGVLPGDSAEKESPQSIADAVDPRVGYTAFRPDWQHVFYTPRPLPGEGEPQMMRRMRGRPVRPLYVFAPDDRRVYRDASWPWGLVGRITTSGGWSGSGALIGNRLVVTAGHVVPWGAGSWWMRFVPAFYDGTSLHGAGVESYVSDARGFDTAGDVTGYDWAVLRLYEPLGQWLGYFGYNGYSSSWEDQAYWTLLGYPGAVSGGTRPSYQSAASVFDDDSDSNGGQELESQVDATPGNSGGPFFGWWGGDPRIIGVVSGQEEDWIFPFGFEKGNVMASGSGFTNLIAWGRTNWQ
jgi:V8-like Glu-specific endopeptidase